MHLIPIAFVTMVAFASNSILNRMAVAQFETDPIVFAVVRVAAGALMLWVLLRVQSATVPRRPLRRAVSGAAALALYMAGFSLAYLSLDAGVGALILFGGVQITMFAGAVLGGERLGPLRIAGAVIALVGLAVLVWPAGDVRVDVWGAALMSAAALGWGLYSLMGRAEANPLAATAGNFALCLPMVLPLLWLAEMRWSLGGIVLAVVAGAVTSGVGYAMWYRIVPQLGAARAAVTQLSVPVIAALGGALVLQEAIGLRFWSAAALVLGGIALSLRQKS